MATRSPSPASPANVIGSAPSAAPSRAVSASPRVISVARVLSPKPIPSAIPQASAITFFTAPPSSQPTTSPFVYGRRYGVKQARCTTPARSGSAQATTVADGCSSAISRARLGPVTTATRSGPQPTTSPITSLIRLALPSSMPFIRLTRVARRSTAGAQPPRLSRSVCAGSASTTMSAPASASPGSVVARSAGGSFTPGR